jgi:hypothetical protein
MSTTSSSRALENPPTAGVPPASIRGLERFKKSVATRFALRAAVFLAFGCVFARSQGAAAMLPRLSLAKSQKSSLRTATEFFKTL